MLVQGSLSSPGGGKDHPGWNVGPLSSLSLLGPGVFVLAREPRGMWGCWGPSSLGAVVTGTSLTHCPPTQGLEVPLVAVIQWSTPKLPFTSSIYTHYQ